MVAEQECTVDSLLKSPVNLRPLACQQFPSASLKTDEKIMEGAHTLDCTWPHSFSSVYVDLYWSSSITVSVQAKSRLLFKDEYNTPCIFFVVL